MFKQVADFITKNNTLILATGGVIVAWWIYQKLKPSDAVSEKLSVLQQGLSSPVDALLANIGIMPKIESGVNLTDYSRSLVESYGGVDAYIAAHKAKQSGGATGSW